ncbi:MAG: galactokinase [Agathobacter sp.]|nr:galactokinase [Agathobacter sp.]
MDTKKVLELIRKGDLDRDIIDIYVDAEQLEYQKERYVDAIMKFKEYYGDGDIEIFSAPGRSEIGGNHTDHQHGKVLACAINMDAIGIVKKVKAEEVRIVSDDSVEIVVDITDLTIREEEKGSTLSLIKGVLAGFHGKGYKIGGFSAYITSDVLIGSGVSSSAAFETLIGAILSGLYNKMMVPAIEIAMIGQFAENIYFGKPCGLMDQMACSIGSLVYIDFLNPEKPHVEKIAFDLEKYGYSLCITDTKGSHADLTDEYAAVPEEMKRVANYFCKEVLVDVSLDELLENVAEMRKGLSDRCILRAIHFLTENKRVEEEANALKRRDVDVFLESVQASGNSSYKFLQNVYSVKNVYQQNVSLALAISETMLGGKGVCRVHGGGFAGTIQAFVKNEDVKAYQATMDQIFGKDSCSVLKIRKYGGIQVV